jgi:hypothetical protein
MGAEASVTLIVVLSIRLYHVPVYGKSCDSLAVTSKLPSTKTSLSCVQGAAFVIYLFAVPIKVANSGCFQANHLCQSV